MRPLEIQTQSNGSGLHQHYSHIQFTNTMDTTNINDFNTAPVVKDYFRFHAESLYRLENELSAILEKKELGLPLSSSQLERDFQFQKFFTWKEYTYYDLSLSVSGSWNGSETTIKVDKDLFDQIEEGDTDSDYSELVVDPYSLDDPSEGIEIYESEVTEKTVSIVVHQLKIKHEYIDRIHVAPDAGTMIEGGAA